MRVIHLPRAHFEEVYWRLDHYMHVPGSNPTACMEDALKYVREHDLLNLEAEYEIDFMQGYRLIIYNSPWNNNSFRSIYISPCGTKAFYEGALPYHSISEFKFLEYMHIDLEDINFLKMKYGLISENDVREWLEETILNLDKKIKTMEVLSPKNVNLPNFRGELRMARTIYEKYVKNGNN